MAYSLFISHLTIKKMLFLKSSVSKIKYLLPIFIICCLFSCKSGNSQLVTSKLEINKNTILVYGDSRTGHDIHKTVVSCMLKFKPQSVFHTGDMVFDGTSDKDWQMFNSITEKIQNTSQIYPVMGNHEKGRISLTKNSPVTQDKTWYSVNINQIHFSILDYNVDYSINSEQYKWLIDDLTHMPADIKFRIVLIHYPPYSTGYHQELQETLQEVLVPVFMKYNIHIVFSGHNHCYERCYVDGIHYIVAGGGGAPMHEQQFDNDYCMSYHTEHHFCALHTNKDTLFVSSIDTNMCILDKFYVISENN